MKGFFIVILLMISSSFGSKAQCKVTSTCGYSITVSVRPIQIITNTTNCQYGYNYEVRFEYNVVVTGSIPSGWCGGGPGGQLFTLQVEFTNFNSKVSGNYNSLPKGGGSGIATTTTNQSIPHNGTAYGYNSPFVSCTAASVSNFQFSPNFKLIIEGPGINYTQISCPLTPPGAPLPVELGSFNGIQNNNQVDLSWLTYSERENETFFIERSTNAVDFDVIGQVNGAGTTSTQQDYFFSDKAPKNGVNYYRLRQRDFDGNEEIFSTIAVNYAGSEAFSSKVFPNPTTENKVEITLNNVQEEHVFIDTYNLLGQLLHTETIHIHSNEQTELIQLNEMEKTYLIVVRTENEILDRHRVLVQK